MQVSPGSYYSKYFERNLFGQAKGERRYLYSFLERYLAKKLVSGSRICDLGCGAGFLSARLSQRFQVEAWDISRDAVEIATRLAKTAQVSQYDGEKIPAADERYDAVVCLDVLEHLKEPSRLLKEIHRSLKKGGVFICSFPNLRSVGRSLKRSDWYAYQDQTHLSLLDETTWKRLIEESGFKVSRVGCDFLWDVPYFSKSTRMPEKLIFMPLQWILLWSFGPLPFRFGETLFFFSERSK